MGNTLGLEVARHGEAPELTSGESEESDDPRSLGA